MRYATVCSGIECFSAGVPSSWAPVFFAENEKFPSAVIRHHYPGIPNHGDIRNYESWPDHAIDVLAGGTPCQSFSIAGLRAGLDDPRGNLMLTYLAIARRYRPRWLVWENVPGVLSSNGGSDFGTLLRGLAELGYHATWRVLDAQFVRVDSHPRAVPQRRRRVFVIGHPDWRHAAAVLLERQSLSGDPAPRREAGKDLAPTIAARTRGGGGLGTDFDCDDCDGGLIAGAAGPLGHSLERQNDLDGHGAYIAFGGNNTSGPIDVATARNSHGGPHGRLDFESETFVAHSLSTQCRCATEDGTGRGAPLIAHSLRADGFDASEDGSGRGTPLIAFDTTQVTSRDNRSKPQAGDPCHGLNAKAHPPAVASMASVRRLTPLECERLMGLPDGYTDLPGRKSDGPRYKALGNGMAVNCVRWICQRIDMVEDIA